MTRRLPLHSIDSSRIINLERRSTGHKARTSIGEEVHSQDFATKSDTVETAGQLAPADSEVLVDQISHRLRACLATANRDRLPIFDFRSIAHMPNAPNRPRREIGTLCPTQSWPSDWTDAGRVLGGFQNSRLGYPGDALDILPNSERT